MSRATENVSKSSGANAPPSVTDELFAAVVANDAQRVRVAIDRGASPDATRENQTRALHVAACMGHLEVARALVKLGAALDTRDAHGNAPLHYAASLCARPDIARLLVGAGAQINVEDRDGRRPVDWTLGNARLETAKFLLSAGADASGMDLGWRKRVLDALRDDEASDSSR